MEHVASVSQSLTPLLLPHGLMLMGALHDDNRTIALIGADALWWDVFLNTEEYNDGFADPIDRWSKRIINSVGSDLNAQTQFPSDGPPYPPFIAWALASGRFWQSPVGMLVHDTTGMMVSLRGALIWDRHIQLDDVISRNPCSTCDQPCVSACPVKALNAKNAYDVDRCHSFLDTEQDISCMDMGCAVRRICPVSQRFRRPSEQSAFHMRAFHPPKL